MSKTGKGKTKKYMLSTEIGGKKHDFYECLLGKAKDKGAQLYR